MAKNKHNVDVRRRMIETWRNRVNSLRVAKRMKKSATDTLTMVMDHM
jgi:hypothetical protein